MEKQIEPRRASTEVVFEFLSGVPWWIVIIAIVGLFVGFSVLTNARYPRAVSPDGDLRGADDWDPVGVHVKTGASIGARSVCVAPVTIGAWAAARS